MSNKQDLIENEDDKQWGNVREAFDRISDDKRKIFFDDIQVAKDGGMREIGKPGLWANTRYISAVLSIVFVFYNLDYILSADLGELWRDTEGTTSTNDPTNYEQDYLFTKFVVDKITGGSLEHVTGPAVIAFIELVMLGVYLVLASMKLGMIAFGSGFGKWSNFTSFCWSDMYRLSTFSAMKLLGFIVPQVLSQDVFYALFYSSGNTALQVAFLLVTRPLCLIIGMDCFLVKYRQATSSILLSDFKPGNFFAAIIFLNQVLGVVNLTFALRNRLYRFVFAGEEGVMTDAETNKKRVWEAYVGMKIWESYPAYQALTLMLSWSDDDFQHMILKEKSQKKRRKNAAKAITKILGGSNNDGS